MNKAGGYIWLHRKILEWEWYSDPVTRGLFIHLLITANFKDTRFLGKKIKRGQLVTSLPSLAAETGYSIQNIRTAIKHLISTGEITDSSNRSYRIITVIKYDEYQNPTDNLTDSQQTANRQLTDSQQYHNKVNNVNKGKKNNSSIGGFTPPSVEEVREYVKEINGTIDPEHFVNYYAAQGWVLGSGKQMVNWKNTVQLWERREKNGANGHSGNRGDAKEEVRSKYADISAQVPVF